MAVIGKKRKKHRGIQERVGKNGVVTFRAQVRLKGKYVTNSVATLQAALDWIEKTRTDVRAGRIASEEKKQTFGDMIDRYIRDVLPAKKKSEPAQKAQLLWWRSQLGIRPLAEVTSDLIGTLRDKLSRGMTKMGRVRTPATVVRYLSALSHVFSIAVREWQ